MTKPIIAVDCDDVLANLVDSMRLYINKTYGLTHTAEDYNVPGQYSRYFEMVWGTSDDEGTERYNSYIEAGELLQIGPINGAIDAIRTLQKNYHLIVVTARGGVQIAQTETWLEQHFPQVFKNVEFMELWEKEGKTTKAAISKELGAEYLIDDNLEHCTLAAEAGLKAVLFGDYGWNQSEALSQHIIRCKDWPAVLKYFDKL